MATGSAAGRKVSQPVEPIPCKIDPVSSREVIAGRTVIAYVHGDLAGQEYANAAVIVRAVNTPTTTLWLRSRQSRLTGQINMTIRTWRLPCIRARAIRDRRHRRPQSV